MSPHDWHLTRDLDAFLASRPAHHTLPLSLTDNLRRGGPYAYGDEAPFFGFVASGQVAAICLRTPPFPLHVTALTGEQADALAGRLVSDGQAGRLSGVFAESGTAALFAESWQRHTGARSVLRRRQRLYRLDELTAPDPLPEGAARVAGDGDREQLVCWYEEFLDSVGERERQDGPAWADSQIARGGAVLWEAPDGTPVAMACSTPVIVGQVRVTSVYTPKALRGRGYAGAATAEASRLALARGAREVLLYTDLANRTSNGLYQRLGYRAVADFAVYDFEEPPASRPEQRP